MWGMVPEIWNKTDIIVCDFGTIFAHLFPLTTQKIKILKKKERKKRLEMSSFYTCAPKIMIIWCMPPEIWCSTNRVFCHFGPFFALLLLTPKFKTWKNLKNAWRYCLFTHVHNKWRYDAWFLRYKMRQIKFFVILGHFLPFDPRNNPRNQNFEKKMKKNWLEILLFYTFVPQMTIIWYMVPEILSATDRMFVILGYVLPFYPTSNLKIKNFEKMKKCLEISSFYTCVA